jgi:hypothetical protein
MLLKTAMGLLPPSRLRGYEFTLFIISSVFCGLKTVNELPSSLEEVNATHPKEKFAFTFSND